MKIIFYLKTLENINDTYPPRSTLVCAVPPGGRRRRPGSKKGASTTFILQGDRGSCHIVFNKREKGNAELS